MGSPPREALAWWRSLSPAERAALLVAAPGVLGNRDGLPVRVRHRANEVRLERDLAGLRSLRERGDLTDREKQVLRNAEAAAAARDEAEQTRDPQTGEPVPVRLLLYDPTAFGGDGAVALGVGDPDIADDISVLVPGLGTDGADIPGLTAHATSVYEAARDADPGASHASIAWIGYDAPDNIPVRDGLAADAAGVVREDLAERGGAALAQAVDGLRASREGEPADVTVIGHSYGSTTAGHAAHDQGLAADDLVFVGSPGVGGGVDDTADLGMSSQHVWAAANSHDVVPHLAGRGSIDLGLLGGIGLGNDPAEDDFGAIRFQAESGSGSETGAHSGYFEDGSESLDNLAHIVTGQYGLVDRAPGVTDPWWGPPRDPELGRSPRPGPSRAAGAGDSTRRVRRACAEIRPPLPTLATGTRGITRSRPHLPRSMRVSSEARAQWRTASSAATWPSISALPTRWSTSAARASCSTSRASSRSTTPPARCWRSVTRPSG